MAKQPIRSDKLAQPSGVFSQATAIEAKGRLVFISGMTARRLDGSLAGIGRWRTLSLESNPLYLG